MSFFSSIFGRFFKREKEYAWLLKQTKNEKERDYLNCMFSFAEGKISTEAFFSMIKQDKQFSEFILSDQKLPDQFFERKFLEKIFFDDCQSYDSKYNLYRIVSNYFLRRKITGNYYNTVAKLIQTANEYTPDYIYIELSELLKDMPQGLSDDEQFEWCRKRCKQVIKEYKYDFKPPEWVQWPEWPSFHDKPMIFNRQEEDYEKVTYYFYDIESGRKKKIVQYF